jgi:hypothetical protein
LRTAPTGFQAGGLAVGLDPAAAQEAIEQREVAAQVGACAALIVLGPKERGQGVALLAISRERQVGQQGQRLAAGEVQLLAVQFNARWAEQVEGQLGHGYPSRATRRLATTGSRTE